MTFGPHHYVPILKCKRAEKTALQALTPVVRGRLTPLMEIVEVKPGKTIAGHLNTAFHSMNAAFAGGAQFFLDAREVSTASAAAARQVFDRAAGLALAFVPVTGISRPATETQAALAHAQRGICLRVTKPELEQGGLDARLLAFLSAHGLDPDGVDLVMDMGAVENLIPATVQTIADEFVSTLGALRPWRTLTLSGTAFPRSMGVTASNTHVFIARTEWNAWTQLHGRRRGLARMPSFGDAAIQHPSGVEGFDPRIHQVSASIRYTVASDWLLIKGSSTRITPASVQFRRLAAQLVSRGPLARFFAGAAHCYGCQDAVRAARGAPRLGSAEVWRRIGTQHHLTTVVGQMASLSWP